VIFSLFKKKDRDRGDVGAADALDEPSLGAGTTSRPNGVVPKELLDIAEAPMELPEPPPLTPKAPESAFAQRQNAPIGVDPKALARAAVAKIDAIESEMSLDFVGKKSSVGTKFQDTGGPKVVGGLPASALKPVERKSISRGEYAQAGVGNPELDSPTALLLGDTALGDAMEIAEGVTAPAVEEAAVLYANHLPDAAIDVLRTAIAEGSLGRSEFSAYQMLFDLLGMQGMREEYEKHALDFVVKFEQSAPTWTERAQTPATPAQTSSAPMVAFKDALDASIVPQLERIKQLAAKHTRLRLDFRGLKSADVVGCELLMRVFTAFSRASHEMELIGTDALINAVQSLIETGRRDASPAAWLMMLELYRITDRKQQFEDLAVDYCVTYEVSPPSWEPPPKNMRSADNPQASASPAQIEGGMPDEIVVIGEIKGNGEVLLKLIEDAMKTRKQVVLNCRKLDRVEFGAAGALLIPLTNWSRDGRHIVFRGVNNLVAGLFVTLGIHQIAGVERRKNA
jgi:anti-anti-sigma regulatory factor